MSRTESAWRVPLDVVDGGVGLALTSIVVRARTIGWDAGFVDAPLAELPKVLAGATDDVLFALLLTTVFLAAFASPLGRLARVRSALRVGFWVSAVCAVIAMVANGPIVALLGQPFTYPWLHYSDFLRSTDARDAITATATAEVFVTAAIALASVPVAGRLVGAVVRRATRTWSRERTVGTVAVLLGAYLWLGNWYVTSERWPSAKTANPVLEFARSWARTFETPVLDDLPTPYDGSDFTGGDGVTVAPRRGLSNVIVFVLESVGANELELFGGANAVTPTLAALAPRAVRFGNVHAHMPGTNPSLVSLHASVYPWISFEAVTAVRPEVRFESLPEVLHAHGRRTAYFSSGSLEFQGAREFLAARSYDHVEGPLERQRVAHDLHSEWAYLSGTSDADTTESLIAWLERNRADGASSFAMLWTLQPHYPYYVTDSPRTALADAPRHERWMQAVRESDAALGRLVAWLDASEVADDTLLVIVADHGEAFGQHGSYGHGSGVYEENLRVPLLLVNAELFHGEASDVLGGLVDVAPTILDCLGIEAPRGWQGRSLYAADRPGRFYACAPWSEFLLCYRDGDWKAIVDALNDRTSVFHLATDPGERVDLALQHPDFVEYAKLRLASWVQHQARFYADAFRELDE